MNRPLVIFAAVLLVAIAAIGAALLWRSFSTLPSLQGGTPPVTFPPDSNPPALIQDSQSKEAVQAVFRTAIAPYNTDNIKLYETVIEGGYALQVWAGDTFGGQALLRYDTTQRHWIVLESSGGSWSVEALVKAGVPMSTALTLFEGVSH